LNLSHFCSGTRENHVYIDTYGPEVEDFGGRRSTTMLDLWVFRKVEGFLNYARADAAFNEKLNQDRTVFFLHLLGLDTAGHTYINPIQCKYCRKGKGFLCLHHGVWL
jgi:phosphatidylinositol glycan class N